jgi:hypothetical protein
MRIVCGKFLDDFLAAFLEFLATDLAYSPLLGSEDV